MRFSLRFFCYLWVLLFFSCQSEDLSSELNDESSEAFEEYFYSTADGAEFNVSDPGSIIAYSQVNPDTGVTSLFFYAQPKENSFQFFGFQLCFYDGPGVYYTGDGLTPSWSYYWDDQTLWYSDLKLDENPAMGIYTITNVTEEIIEGEFVITAYNSYDLNSLIEISGEFGVFCEEPPQY